MSINDCIKELSTNKKNDNYVLDSETMDFIIIIMRRYKMIEDIVNKGIISRLPRVAYIVMGCYDGKDD